MRQIEKEMNRAIAGAYGDRWQNSNTAVTHDGDRCRVTLHGNCIAEYDGSDWRYTLAGWNTPTTRSRLNALLQRGGARRGISTRQGQATVYYAADPSRNFTVDADQWWTA